MSELDPEYTLPPAQPFEGGAWEPVPYRVADWPTPPPQGPVVFGVGAHSFNPLYVADVHALDEGGVEVTLVSGRCWTFERAEAARFRELWTAWAVERR